MLAGGVTLSTCSFIIMLEQLDKIPIFSILENNTLWAGIVLGFAVLLVSSILNFLKIKKEEKEKTSKDDNINDVIDVDS
ncbi:MAG: hypothetical protein LBJ93_01340 [Clostridiales bacterium]|jgi:hypothetical protein|nr:hypothetical protein [Clostridiales bacterium]